MALTSAVTSKSSSTTGGVTTDLKGVLQSLLKQFMPGGEIEQQRFSEAEKEGKRFQASLAGNAIQRGLGNAAIGIPTQVFEQVQNAKKGISSELSGQYLGVLTNLLSLSAQEEQAALDREFNASQNSQQAAQNASATRNQNNQTEKQRQQEEWQAALAADRSYIQNIENQRSSTSKNMSAGKLPALYQAGGYGQQQQQQSESLFTKSDLDMFGTTTGTSSSNINYGGFGTRYQDPGELAATIAEQQNILARNNGR